MTLFYQLIGLTAQIGALLSRRRVNYITSSVVPLFVGFLFTFALLMTTLMSIENGSVPQETPLKALNTAYYSGSKYLSVKGSYIPSQVYELRGKKARSGIVPGTYVAFMDSKKTAVILVAVANTDDLPQGEVTLVGMAEPMPTSTNGELAKHEQGLPFLQDYYLQPGATPTSPVLAGMGCLLVAVPTTLYFLAFVQRYVIFRGGDALTVTSGRPAAPNLPTLFATGCFYLQQKGSERFLEAPATLTVLPSGEIALYVLADASRRSSFYFIPTGTEDRSGYWISLVAPGSVQNVQSGLQYLGLSARWALRFSYLDAISRRPETMVLAFAEEGLRSQIRAELEKVSRAS